MRPERFVAVVFVAALLLVAAAVASCGGEETTTSLAAPTTTSAVTSTIPATTTTTVGVAGLDAIRIALEASEDIADDFEVADYLIMQQWAGAIVSAPMVDDANVLLKRGAAGWEVVAVFSEMSRQDLLAYGAPEEITAFLSYETTTTTAVGPSPESIAYAEGLGGTSHEGETLYAVIGASAETEREAQRLLEDALPSFGDMQSYFIVQRSDNFEGMDPGWWVVIEAYYNNPDSDELDFCRRGFPDAYVKEVTVRTPDPIPVYEDMVGTTELEVIRDVIAQSGSVAGDFEIVDYLISDDDKWAGVIIASPGLENCPVLLFHSGLVGWAVMDLGTGLSRQGILDEGAPPEIAEFLVPGG
jgi:hypothetical protein